MGRLTTSLDLDDSGDLWLVLSDDEGYAAAKLLGAVEDAGGSVPEPLLETYEALRSEWDERVAFGAGCRAAARSAFLSAAGDPGRRSPHDRS